MSAPPSIPLSEEQRAAVEHAGSPLIVLAGPGTGKTRVITARVAHLVRERGADPARVLAVTFTNKAAGELKERLGELLPSAQAQSVTACTLHAYGVRLLRRFGDMLGLPPDIEILDEAQQRALARELIRANRLYRASIGRGIDHAVDHGLKVAHELVSTGITPEEAARRAEAALADLASDGSAEARARKAELSIAREGIELARLMDGACLERATARFDDLITWPMLLMRRSDTAASIVRHECRHVVVDEFQDLNATQIEWLGLLCPPRSNPDLCVVGDDDQSIYAFRGADERAFDRFESFWKNTATLRLTTNYRSGPGVIEASNAIIGNAGYRFDDSKFGRPGPTPPAASSVELVRVGSDMRVGQVAAAMIRDSLVADPALDLSQIAVIARTGPELLRCAGALDAAGIPYTCSVPDASREDAGVRAVLAWAALVTDPTRAWAARAVLTRPPFSIDAATLGTLEHRYRQQRAWANANPGEEEPGPFVAWLSAHAPSGTADALRHAAEVEASIAEVAATDTADHAIMHAIRVSGVAHAEALPPRERAARVRALVALVRFTRERLPRLEEPRGLRELLAYIDDLPAKQKAFARAPEDHLAEADDASAEPGVRLLTAHASKGLEFDTVYLLRCTSPHGFPSPKTDPPVLPAGVADPDPQGRDARARVDDEERRVFFVALTRAERRAVMLGKIPKKSSGVNYAIELRAALGPALVEHEEADIAPTGGDDLLSAEEIESGLSAERAAVLAAARRAARRDAARVLDEAERRDEPDESLAASLRLAADRLALVRALERTGAIPRWAAAAGLTEEAARLADRLRADDVPGVVFPGVTGPMTLSYTHISRYLACPRCYYLSFIQGLPGEPSSAMSIGTAVHRALQIFANDWALADSEGRPTPDWDRLEAETRRCFFHEWPRDQELDHNQLERAIAMTRAFFDHLHPDDAHIIKAEQPFAFPFEVDGLTHTIKGKIDRIDQTPSGSARIIDYKTGNPTQRLLEPKKDDLQMAIYAMALPALGIDEGPGATCEYWVLSSGQTGAIPIAALNLPRVRQTIADAVRGMAAGQWDQGRECPGLCAFLDEPED